MKQINIRPRHGAWVGVMTTFIVIILLAASVLTHFLMWDRMTLPDMTQEGLYTPTDAMMEECGKLGGEVTVTFCADPDRLLANYELRYVYILARQLANRISGIRVETYDIGENPTAVARFRTTSASVINASDVIVSSGARYRILGAKSFWTRGENSTGEGDYYSFNGEYRLATAFLSVTAVSDPIACIAYGHGEHYYVAPDDTDNAHLAAGSDPEREAFWGLLRDEGLRVRYWDPEREELPEGCVLIVVDSPTSDWGITGPASLRGESAISRMHTFLSANNGSVMLFKDPTVTLPNLENFAADWGIRFEGGSYVRDTESSLTDPAGMDAAGRNQTLIAALPTDETSMAYAVVGDLASLATAPRLIVNRSGTVRCGWMNSSVGGSGVTNVVADYSDFFRSSPTARKVTPDGLLDSDGESVFTLAALAARTRYDKATNEGKSAYCFGAASTDLTTNVYLSDRAYANYDVLYALVRYISRTDEYASMSLGGTSLNSENMGGKRLIKTALSASGNEVTDKSGNVVRRYAPLTGGARIAWTVVLTALPVLLLTGAGVWVIRRRRNR